VGVDDVTSDVVDNPVAMTTSSGGNYDI